MKIKSKKQLLFEAVCICLILTVILIVLKLMEIINCHWLYVFSPILFFKTPIYLLWTLIDLVIFEIKLHIKLR